MTRENKIVKNHLAVNIINKILETILFRHYISVEFEININWNEKVNGLKPKQYQFCKFLFQLKFCQPVFNFSVLVLNFIHRFLNLCFKFEFCISVLFFPIDVLVQYIDFVLFFRIRFQLSISVFIIYDFDNDTGFYQYSALLMKPNGFQALIIGTDMLKLMVFNESL